MMDSAKTILLVEDNEQLNDINRRALIRAGYHVVTALTLAAARICLGETLPDAILLDIMLPDGSGVDFCREIREHTAAPILFLTSVSGYDQTLSGLAAGGDDYLNKPFDMGLLLAKVAAFLRRDDITRRVRPPENTLTRGALTLDIPAARAFLHSRDLLLTQKEFALLLALAQNENTMLSQAELYETAWNQPMGDNDQVVRTTLSRLRKKLETGGYTIHAERGEGYRLDRR